MTLKSWFSHCVLRHTFILRTAIHGTLSTQDRLLQPYPEKSVVFKSCPGSHEHLFFKSHYASRHTWCLCHAKVCDLRTIIGSYCLFHLTRIKRIFANCSRPWNEMLKVVAKVIRLKIVNQSALWSIIRRLVFTASVYHIRLERNMHIVKQGSRSVDKLVNNIFVVVTLKLISFSIKHTRNTLKAEQAPDEMMHAWCLCHAKVRDLRTIIDSYCLFHLTRKVKRIFANCSRPWNELLKVVAKVIRLKIVSLIVKQSVRLS
ncbi:Phytosulfokine [Artemisia annua]|uniref:Phytosulfokine n=1 Tax=Artemisia annua TaxID=35608 RepID=A0A2U1PUX8_ARTAN|nr:Phytosulfokine [Artemisia annua]